jgi:hypothetical protein
MSYQLCVVQIGNRAIDALPFGQGRVFEKCLLKGVSQMGVLTPFQVVEDQEVEFYDDEESFPHEMEPRSVIVDGKKVKFVLAVKLAVSR